MGFCLQSLSYTSFVGGIMDINNVRVGLNPERGNGKY